MKFSNFETTKIFEVAKLFYSKTLSTKEILKKYSIKPNLLYAYCYQYTKIYGKPPKTIKEKTKEKKEITLTNREFEIAKLFYSWKLSNDEILQKYSITLTQLRFYCLKYRKIYGEQFRPVKEKKIPKKEKKLAVDFRTQQNIIELYKRRNAPSKITKILNIPVEKIEYVLHRYRKTLPIAEANKLNLRTFPLTKEEQEQVINLYFNEMKSMQYIAKQANKNIQQIYHTIRRYRERNMPLYVSNQEKIAELKKEEQKLTDDELKKLTQKQIIALCKRNKNMIFRIAMAQKINMYELLSWLK
jgi:transposase-like protein